MCCPGTLKTIVVNIDSVIMCIFLEILCSINSLEDAFFFDQNANSFFTNNNANNCQSKADY